MIKGLTQSSKYLTVSSGNASTYVNGYSGAQGVGNMRYNTTNQNIEVWDGNNWIMLNMNHASIGMTPEAESLLDWARQKRDEELQYKNLASQHPAVAIALENLNKAQEQLKATVILSQEYDKNTAN